MRLKFAKGKQRELINRYLIDKKINLKKLAGILKVEYGKLKAYYYEDSLIPENILNKIAQFNEYKRLLIEKKEEHWGQKKGGAISNGNTKNISFPEESRELAEFYGVMLGDGNSTRIKGKKVGTYSIKIVGDSRYDKEYLSKYVKQLIEDLFDIKTNLRKQKHKNAIFIEAHGKMLVNFLEKKGFKPGNKIKNRLEIPAWIKNNEEYLVACIRGLFDTDGSFYKLTNQNTHQINFKNFNLELLQDFRAGLIKLGINCSKISKKNSVYITKKEEIAKFFKVVGSNNFKHLNKFKMSKIAP